MGMDMVAIVEHHFSESEILQLPEKIDENRSIRELYEDRHQNQIDYNPILYNRKSDWCEKGDRIMNDYNLQRIWKQFKEDTEIKAIEGYCYDTTIDCYFGTLNIYESTIAIKLFPEHKYGNLRNPNSSKYVFSIIREIANLINSKRILYCCDSYYIPSILEEKSRMGWTFDSLLSYGNKRFGIPPKELNAAIENLYFVDDFDLNLDELNSEKKVWSRAKYECDKEQKGEPPYNTVYDDQTC